MTISVEVIFWRALLGLAAFGLASSFVFLFLAIIAAIRFKRRSESWRRAVLSFFSDQLPPVTIFKPVHGMEERLGENFEGFFQQNYPGYEIIIGSRREKDGGSLLAEGLW